MAIYNRPYGAQESCSLVGSGRECSRERGVDGDRAISFVRQARDCLWLAVDLVHVKSPSSPALLPQRRGDGRLILLFVSLAGCLSLQRDELVGDEGTEGGELRLACHIALEGVYADSPRRGSNTVLGHYPAV